jgi:hypothetical protein
MTFLSQGVVNKLHERQVDVGQNISQFGWQFERQFYSKQSGVTALNEWVFLLGGLDQNVAIPSLSWLVGLRTKEGAEFGVGPNVTPPERHPRRRCARACGGRHDASRCAQRADEFRGRSHESGHAGDDAHRVYDAALS